jgi:hypothetical protein
MKYAMLLYANESDAPHTPEQIKAARPAWDAMGEALEAANVEWSGNGLSSVANATTVRVRDGRTLITDGPFAETHEQLGGIFLFDCKDLDEAISCAAKIPTAGYGSVEIRPLWGMSARGGQ